jgi:hypothetical protein
VNTFLHGGKATHSTPIRVLAGTLLAGVAFVAMLLVGALPSPAPGVFTDAETPGPPTPAPTARNRCETVFFDQLMRGWDAVDDPIASPAPEQLRAVFNACTASELLAADEHYAFASGRPFQQLIGRRLFNGPSIPGQLGQMCRIAYLAHSTACSQPPG